LESQIQDLRQEIAKKRNELGDRQQQLESHKKFSTFLQEVVKDKKLAEIIAAANKTESGKSESEQSIMWLRERFINLKKENKRLKERKALIAAEREKVLEDEKRQVEIMTRQMYDKGKEMQEIQNEIEKVQAENTKLDSEFENQVRVQNQAKEEAHQILYSIDNIYQISHELYKYRDQEKKFKRVEDNLGDVFKIE